MMVNVMTQLTLTCSNSTIETLEKGVKYVLLYHVFIVYFEHISHLFLVFLLLTVNHVFLMFLFNFD